ncbi:capsular polysaccharide synthesis protein [Acinetobacter nosocomialis]|uniref:glycosyltransferase family 32 protein n=1 Tax=Acinetobacter nosocomialis TaxID=106654 RepID=UPI000B3DE80C|nr:capsular polysaccharide synthesis protein [Acinetobacter nosocomialis]MDC4318532.1 capsular polysaccharide synthesis protein [Acinetobacter baumannii]MDQ9041438.1 capsular polysaccharide synthesis protein [Acinetobacter nosocomialis]OUT28018.1 mannosyltransferase OCH1-like protein [Acinetobacter nosocomialis P020]PSE18151.1 hypothetical protein C7G95_01555 [Acinetobacter nosocomialis]QBF79886.1 hypothetical protein KAN02_18570 [Acinetobacter nosocomialis]
MGFVKKQLTHTMNLLYVIWVSFFGKKVKTFIPVKNHIIDTLNNQNEIHIPKIIWMFWNDKELPELVFYCIENIKKLHPDFEVNILNCNNVGNFIDINFFELTKKMPLPNISDLIRLKLLSRYGGIWMDSSIILQQPLDEFFLLSGYDLIGYYNVFQTINGNVPVIESWLLAAPKNSKFILTWLEIFQSVEELGSHLFFEEFKKDPDFMEFSSGLTNPEYLIVYLAARKAYKKLYKSLSLKFYPCDDSAFSVSIYSNWRTKDRLVNFYIKDSFINSPIHKLTSGEREYYGFLKKYKLINPKSVIGSFLEMMKND